jgi:FkbM family methyltransferase
MVEEELIARLTRHFKERGDTLSIDCLKFHLSRSVYGEEFSGEAEYNQYLEKREVFLKKVSSTGVVIYGAGDEGRLTFEELNANGIKIHAFLDTYKAIDRGELFLGVPIITLAEYLRKYNSDNIPIVITPVYSKHEIIKHLEDNGISNHCLLVEAGKELAQILSGRVVIPEAKRLYELSGEKRYFSVSELIPSDSEVFVDVGAKDGNTTRDFVDWCDGNYSKIHVFEPEPDFFELTFNNLKKYRDVTISSKGCGEQDAIIKFSTLGLVSQIADNGTIEVPIVKLDEVLRDENITFMKYGNSGNELSAIKGSEKIITKHRPKIASIVSNYESVCEIPRYLWQINPDYKIYLRHYSNYTSVTVMYALP